MRIGLLQFSPQVGEVSDNMLDADTLLAKADPKDLDLLILPELAFSGYNFKSLEEIAPFLEPTTAGLSSLWASKAALKYDCVVIVGYPEEFAGGLNGREYYNAAVTCGRQGQVLANYRKSFLYYTDETWALEGPTGFYAGDIPDLGRVAMGICMDLNPYKFEAPWNAYEFANHVLHREANLVVLSMAWLTLEPAETFLVEPLEPHMETLSYWIQRIAPLLRKEGGDEIIFVFANRAGVEGDVVYAGSSCVLGVHDGEVRMYGLLGRGENELLVVDTSLPPKVKLVSMPSRTAEAGMESNTDGAAYDKHDDRKTRESSDSRPVVEPELLQDQGTQE